MCFSPAGATFIDPAVHRGGGLLSRSRAIVALVALVALHGDGRGGGRGGAAGAEAARERAEKQIAFAL